MRKYLTYRMGSMIFTLWVVSVISFVVIQLPPGDYVTSLLAQMARHSGGHVNPELLNTMRQVYGFDEPVYIQYFKWMRNILVDGQFGYSFIYRKDAIDLILERLPMTFAVSAFSAVFVWVVSLSIGVYSAAHQYSPVDYAATAVGFVGLAVPPFLLALILMYVSYRYFGEATIGLFSPEYLNQPWSLGKVGDLLTHLWLPASIVGVGGTAGLIRTMRANLLDELRRPYVDTARAKGLAEPVLLWKYPVRHALNPFVSTLGWLLPDLISGEVIVSMVLNLPTSGPILLETLLKQDMYVAAGFILVLSALTVIGTFISDILLAWLDPRVRLA